MGKLNEQTKTILEIAARDAIAGRRVLITTGSSIMVDRMLNFVRYDPTCRLFVVDWDACTATAPNGGQLRFAPVRNFRDLERLRGREIEELVSLGVQHRFVDMLRPWFEGRGVKFTLAKHGE